MSFKKHIIKLLHNCVNSLDKKFEYIPVEREELYNASFDSNIPKTIAEELTSIVNRLSDEYVEEIDWLYPIVEYISFNETAHGQLWKLEQLLEEYSDNVNFFTLDEYKIYKEVSKFFSIDTCVTKKWRLDKETVSRVLDLKEILELGLIPIEEARRVEIKNLIHNYHEVFKHLYIKYRKLDSKK